MSALSTSPYLTPIFKKGTTTSHRRGSALGLESLIFLVKEMLTLFIVALNTDVVSSLIYHERDPAVLSPPLRK